MEKPTLEVIKTQSRIRALIEAMPKICKCPYPERLSEMFLSAYDNSLDNENGSAFNRTDSDMKHPGQRLYYINPLLYHPIDTDTAMVAFARLVIAEYRTYLQKKYIDKDEFDKIVELNSVARQENELVDDILTFEEAMVTEYWWW